VTGRLFLPDDWVLNANYAFTDITPGNPFTRNDVGSSNRLDIAVSKDLAKGNEQILVGISDLLNKTHDPIKESSQLTGHKVAGRILFLSLMLRF